MVTKTGELLARLDERTERMENDVSGLTATVSSLEREIRGGYVGRSEFKAHAESTVTRDEFKPVQSIVYGMVALFGAGIITAIGVLIFKGGGG